MIQRTCVPALLLALGALASSPAATAVELPQGVTSALGKASDAVVRAEQSVKRSARRADAAIQRGSRAAGHAVSNTARKLGLPTTTSTSTPETP
jgi:hypothetical protein